MVLFVKKMPKPKNWYSNCLNMVPPPIQFKQAIWSKDTDDGTVASFKPCCNPTNMDSLQYELKVHSFDTESVKQYILWKKDLKNSSLAKTWNMPVTSLP